WLLTYGLVVKLVQVLVTAVLIQWSFASLGVAIGHAQASIFIIAGMIGTLIWIVPGGLGVREGISAALAPFVGLGPAQAFLAATVLRGIVLLGVLPFALFFLFSNRRLTAAEPPPPPGTLSSRAHSE